jgi:hypothetical protein
MVLHRDSLRVRAIVEEATMTPNQAAGANGEERRSATRSNRGPVAALPAMAQLFRSATPGV